MAKITLDLPETFIFSTEIHVNINYINYGGHVGNDSIFALIHEARLRCLQQYGFTSELNGIDSVGLIMTDAAIVYKSEIFHGNTVVIAIGLQDFNKYGCDFVYKLTDKTTQKEFARAKTGIVGFDYCTRKVIEMPIAFKTIFYPA